MAGSTGFEPATSGLTVQCANQAAPRARKPKRYHAPSARSNLARLKRPAATSARAAAGPTTARREAAGPTREAAGAGRQDRLGGGAAEEREPRVIAAERERRGARVPAGRVHLDPVEAEDPALGDAERDRPRQKPMERVERHALEPVLLGALEKFLKPAHAREHLDAAPRAAGHGARPAEEDEAARPDRDRQRDAVGVEPRGPVGRQEERRDDQQDARDHPVPARMPGRGGEQ